MLMCVGGGESLIRPFILHISSISIFPITGGILERGVSSVFSSISASIDVSFDDTDTVSRVYSVLAKRIMGSEQDQWSWGRIVALIAISASIGLDCAVS